MFLHLASTTTHHLPPRFSDWYASVVAAVVRTVTLHSNGTRLIHLFRSCRHVNMSAGASRCIRLISNHQFGGFFPLLVIIRGGLAVHHNFPYHALVKHAHLFHLFRSFHSVKANVDLRVALDCSVSGGQVGNSMKLDDSCGIGLN